MTHKKRIYAQELWQEFDRIDQHYRAAIRHINRAAIRHISKKSPTCGTAPLPIGPPPEQPQRERYMTQKPPEYSAGRRPTEQEVLAHVDNMARLEVMASECGAAKVIINKLETVAPSTCSYAQGFASIKNAQRFCDKLDTLNAAIAVGIGWKLIRCDISDTKRRASVRFWWPA